MSNLKLKISDSSWADIALESDLNTKENLSNKVTSINNGSTDAQYPSAKAVYDAIDNLNLNNKQDSINDLSTIRSNSDLGASALQSATIAGIEINKTDSSISVAELQDALGIDNLEYLPVTGGTLTGDLTATGFTGDLTGNASTADEVNHVLNITVGGIYKGSYNGSADKFIDVNAVDLNISSALTFLGITETIPTTESVTLLDNSVVTAVNGNVVIYKTTGQEYFFDGTSWEALGAAESYSIADHTHGNITNEGYITGASSTIVITDGTSQIVAGPAITSGGTNFLREDGTWQNALTSHQDISGKEDTSNKVTNISVDSTNDQYPTALAVYNYLNNALANGGYVTAGSQALKDAITDALSEMSNTNVTLTLTFDPTTATLNSTATYTAGFSSGDTHISTYNIPYKGTTTYTPTTTNQIISANQYLTGDQIILGDSNLQSQYLKPGVSIFGITSSLTTKSSETYTPTTTNQTISAGQYLGENQTILGDPNLLASNIREGVSIFGITGTY